MTLTPILHKLESLFTLLPSIGIEIRDSETMQLQKKFMNSMALLMSMGGVLWGSISLHYDAYLAGIIPIGYTICTAINLSFFHIYKNFPLYRFIQVLMSLLLPFFFQWSLGGVVNSGGMMLWSFLALVGSMSVQSIRLSIYWLIAYIALSIFSGFTDSYFHQYSLGVPDNVIIWFFVVNIVFVSTVIFSLTLYYIHSRNTANTELTELANNLEKKVENRTQDLETSNSRLSNLNHELNATVDQIQDQNELIARKNKSITDSLNYARRIQHALLDSNDQSCHYNRELFIYFKPKDIVSGDFYWFHCDEEKNLFISAVVDCTGHGVPGAFMSLIGDFLLNQIIVDKDITDPDEILYAMDKGIEKALKTEESNRRDGMDMAIIVMDKSTKIKYAGAKIPLVHICGDNINVIKGSVHPIGGGHTRVTKTFNTHTVDLPANTMVYLFSDGYPDQLGGKNGRKYLSKHFRSFLQSITHLPALEQNKALGREFEAWQGEYPQTDDNLVVGLRI